MKILAGQFKNHAIQSNKKFEYRPTTSIARKSIFDTLKSLEGKISLIYMPVLVL